MKIKNLFKNKAEKTSPKDLTSSPQSGSSHDKQSASQNNKLLVEEKILRMLKTVFDPEIPVNIYDLGLIYKIDLHDDMTLDIDMTMTAPNCPAADFIIEDVNQKVSSIDEIKEVNINLVFYPEWTKDMMSDEAKLELNML